MRHPRARRRPHSLLAGAAALGALALSCPGTAAAETLPGAVAKSPSDTGSTGSTGSLASTGSTNSSGSAGSTGSVGDPGSTGRVASSAAVDSLPKGPLPVSFSVGDAFANAVLHPNTPPPGADDPECRPAPEHPLPVVLVHGTLANRTLNFHALAPVLRNAGYCVFTFDYGQEPGAGRFGFPGASVVGGTGPVERSAHELDAFVEKVRARTGSDRVDIVGHSQGGMLPRWYVKFLGGAPKVAHLVGLAPSNHGTDFWGLMRIPAVRTLVGAGLGASMLDQSPDSAVLRRLNGPEDGGETPAGPDYTVITTRWDEVVTPWTSALLPTGDATLPDGPSVHNVVLQDSCPLNGAEHNSLAFNPAAMAHVLHALDPSFTVRTPCTISPPLLGG